MQVRSYIEGLKSGDLLVVELEDIVPSDTRWTAFVPTFGKHKRIPGVLRIETPTSLIQVDSGRNAGSMERALNGAFIGMMNWLTHDYGLDTKEVYVQLSVNPEIVIHTYQFVGPAFYVVGVEFPKKYL